LRLIIVIKGYLWYIIEKTKYFHITQSLGHSTVSVWAVLAGGIVLRVLVEVELLLGLPDPLIHIFESMSTSVSNARAWIVVD